MARYSKVANSLFMARMNAKQQLMQQAMQQQQQLEQQRQFLSQESLSRAQLDQQNMDLQERRRREDRKFALDLATAEAQAAAATGKSRPQYSDTTRQAMADIGYDMSLAEQEAMRKKREQELFDAKTEYDRSVDKAKLEASLDIGKSKAERDYELETKILGEASIPAQVWGTAQGATLDMPLKGMGSLRQGQQMDWERQRKAGVDAARAGVAPTTGNKSKLQGSVFDTTRMLSSLESIKRFDANEFLGYFPKGKSELAKFMSNVGQLKVDPVTGEVEETAFTTAMRAFGGNPEDLRRFAEDYRAMKSEVDGLFNEYRRIVTGAAASERELEALQGQFINMAQDPISFRAMADQIAAKMKRDAIIAEQLMAEGYTVGSEEYGNELARRIIPNYIYQRAHRDLRSALGREPTPEEIDAAAVELNQ